MLDLLDGIRVVSFNHFLLGPMGIQALGDLGADVIAVENADGRLAAPLGRRQYLARWPERAASVRQPQQAQRRHRPEVRRRARDSRLRLVDTRRRGGGELPPRRDGEAGPRLRDAEGAQAQPDLCLGLRLRPRWSLCREARPGPAGAGAVRHDGHHRPGGTGPRPAGASVIDHHGAALFAMGILAAIVRRQRTGQGCRVDASLMQSALDLQAEIAGGVAQRAEETGPRPGLPPRRRLVLRRALWRLRHQATAIWPCRCRRWRCWRRPSASRGSRATP